MRDARSVPVSSSCIVNRPETLALLDEVRATLPAELASARSVLQEADAVVAAAREEAARTVAGAAEERARLLAEAVEQTEVVRAAREAADRLLAEARDRAGQLRRDADEYVDGRLARLEVVLARTSAAVQKGRATLRGRLESDDLRGDEPDEPDRPAAT